MKIKQSRFTKIILPMIALTALAISPGAYAGTCGKGKILEIKEGGWNQDDLFIKIDYSNGAAVHGNTLHPAYVRYRATQLSQERLRGIRAIAYLALAGDKSVATGSHNTADNDTACDQATELNIFR